MVHVLLSTDYSDQSFQAALYAARLLGLEGVKYTTVHAYLDADPSPASWSGLSESMFEAAREGMADWERRLRGSAEFTGAELHTEVQYGPLVGVLNGFGAEQGADLLVMGTQGHGGSVMLGSNAAAMVKRSKFPVLVVPAKADSRSMGKILLADDQQGMDVAGGRMLVHIASRMKAEVLLAHVLRDGAEVPDPDLVGMYDELLKDIPHRYISTEGEDVAAALDLMAGQEGAGLIAVVHRHAGFLEGLFHASTAKRLALYTNTPLLVLQDFDDEAEEQP